MCGLDLVGLIEFVSTGNLYIADAQSVVVSIRSTMTNITDQTSCPPTNDQLLQVLETGICTQSFQGIFLIWIGQYTTTSLLLFATILASFMLSSCVAHFWLSSDAQTHTQQFAFGGGETEITNPASAPYATDLTAKDGEIEEGGEVGMEELINEEE
jgi:hypothetical protein